MQAFSAHENVIQLLNVIKAKNDIDIYLVFEFMDTDLDAVIKAGILTPIHHQYIMYQVMIVFNSRHLSHTPTNSLLLMHGTVQITVFASFSHFGA